MWTRKYQRGVPHSGAPSFGRAVHSRNPQPARFDWLRGVAFAIALAWFPFCAISDAQIAAECVRLKATHNLGVPLHREARNSFHGDRLPGDATVEVIEASGDSKWLRVRLAAIKGWISKSYVESVVPCGTLSPSPLSSSTASLTVGTWNLEWLHNSKRRGFPEYRHNAEFPPRTDADFLEIARFIQTLGPCALALVEINGQTAEGEDEAEVDTSAELDRLVGALGDDRFAYAIGSSGGSQRIAFLFDTAFVQIEWFGEVYFQNDKVGGEGLFDRQPLLGYFRAFSDGAEMNDFVLVGVHLASGQHLTKNHDMAMDRIASWVTTERGADGLVPAAEFDIVIAGDLNPGTSAWG